MFKNTKNHLKETPTKKPTIKIGKVAPSDSVNLGFFYNKKSSPKENILVSDAPKNIIDHITAYKWLYKNSLPAKDDSLFSPTFFYKDSDGYSGMLKRAYVLWKENKNVKKISKIINMQYSDLKYQVVPSSMPYTESDMKGNLFLVKETYSVDKSHEVDVPGSIMQECYNTLRIEGLTTAKYDFPAEIPYNKDGFVGNLKRVDSSIKYIPIVSGGIVSKTATYYENIPEDMLTPPSTHDYVINGVTYTLPLIGIEGGILTEKAYGVGAYYTGQSMWAYGCNGGYFKDGFNWVDNNGVARKTAGYVSDRYPLPMADRYLHGVPTNHGGTYQIDFHNFDKKIHRDFPDGTWAYPFLNPDGSNVWNDIYGDELSGTKWSYDVSTAAAYGGVNHAVYGGMTWAREYKRCCEIIHGGFIWPPPGYQTDKSEDGSNHRDFTISAGVAKSDPNRYIYFGKEENSIATNGAFKFDGPALPATRHHGIGTDTSRIDFVAFYNVQRNNRRAKYQGQIIAANNVTYIAVCDYKAVLTKSGATGKQTVIDSWKCDAIYEGVLTSTEIKYDGSAFYKGIATKRNSVGNINPTNMTDYIMYPNNINVLQTYDSQAELESELFYITNIFKDNIPLYYKQKLNYSIYSSETPDELGILENSPIKIVNANMKSVNSKYKYQVVLEATPEEGFYNAYVYTSFYPKSNEKFFVSYNGYKSDGTSFSILKPNQLERLEVFPCMEINKEYFVTETDPAQRKNKITITSPNIIKDERRKIPVIYQIVCGDYKTSDITCSVLNRRYAFDNELSRFIDNNYIVSPYINGHYLTAFELLKNEFSSITAEYLKTHNVEIRLKTTTPATGDVTEYSTGSEYMYEKEMYTSPDGSSVVSCFTTIDTGFYNENEFDENGNAKYNKKIHVQDNSIVVDGYIYPAYSVKCRDIKKITVLPPKEENVLENWHTRIQFGHFTQIIEENMHKLKFTYSIPEYNNQNYSTTYKRPYIDVVDEHPVYINENAIQTKMFPLYISTDSNFNITNITIKRNNVYSTNISTNLTIKYCNFIDGYIELNEIISENDDITISYTFEEQTFNYKGFTDTDSNFIDIELNPNMYHTYLDNTGDILERKNVYELFNKTVYYFIGPSKIEEINLTPYVEATVTLTKVDEDTDSPIDGAVFGFYDYTDNLIGEYTCDSDGKIKIEKVHDGNYYFKEKTPPNGYAATNDLYAIQVIEDYSNIGIKIKNKKISSNLEIINKDTTGAYVQGVQFNLCKSDGTIMSTHVSDANGDISVPALPYGDYYVQATGGLSTPYTLNNTKVNFSVTKMDQTIRITVIHQRAVSKVILTSLDQVGNLPVPNCNFDLYNSSNVKISTHTTDSLGKFTIAGLSVGDYYFKQTSSPIIYATNKAEQYDFKVYADKDTNIKVINYLKRKVLEVYSTTSGPRLQSTLTGDGYDSYFDITSVNIKEFLVGTISMDKYIDKLNTFDCVMFGFTDNYRGGLSDDVVTFGIPRTEVGYNDLAAENPTTSSYILNEEERAKLSAYANNGGGVIFTHDFHLHKDMRNNLGINLSVLSEENIGFYSRYGGLPDKVDVIIEQDSPIWHTPFSIAGDNPVGKTVQFALTHMSNDTLYVGTTGRFARFQNLYQLTADSITNPSAPLIPFTTAQLNGRENYFLYMKDIGKGKFIKVGIGHADIRTILTGIDKKLVVNLVFNASDATLERSFSVTYTSTTTIGGSTDIKYIDAIPVIDDITIEWPEVVRTPVSEATYKMLGNDLIDGKIVTVGGQRYLVSINLIKESDYTLYHKIDDPNPINEYDLMIGKVFVRHHTSLKSTYLIDTRTRGGGILTSIKDDIRRTLEPESDYYLDIGYYDGEAYNENAVVIIRIDRNILKNYGGRFTEGDVENAVKKWIAYGVLPIIEYIEPITNGYEGNVVTEISNIIADIDINATIESIDI